MKKLFDATEDFRRKEFREKIEIAEASVIDSYKDEIYAEKEWKKNVKIG